MSFQYAPAQFRIPPVPGYTPPTGIWCGKGPDAGRLAFQNGNWGGYVMTDGSVCFSLEVDGQVLDPVYSSVNGYCYWGLSPYVYFSQSWGWVVTWKFPGYEPIEESKTDPESGETTYSGDNFFVFNSVPAREGTTVEATGRGENRKKTGGEGGEDEERDKSKIKIKAVWRRWVGTKEFGKYEGRDGASGERRLGLPRFNGNGQEFVRSFEKENGHYRYGDIHYAEGVWVLGERGSEGGWHEGSEPKVDGSVSFAFKRNEGSDAEGSNITVSFRDYVKGEEAATAFLGEVALWR